MQHLGVNFGGIWRFELFFFIWVFIYFCSVNLGWFLKVQWQHCWSRASNTHIRPHAIRRVQWMSFNAIIYPFKSAIMWRIQTPHWVQLMNIVSDYIFDFNNRDANRAFVTFRENTAPVATTSNIGLLNAKFTFNGTSPTNHFCTDS